MYNKLTPQADSLINVTNNKIAWLRNTPNFDYTHLATISGQDIVSISPHKYIYNREMEVLATSLQFKLNATRVLMLQADSLIAGLQEENNLNKTMLRLKTREANVFEKDNNASGRLIKKQRNAIANLERSNKIYRRRNIILGSTAIAAITTAIIISIYK